MTFRLSPSLRFSSRPLNFSTSAFHLFLLTDPLPTSILRNLAIKIAHGLDQTIANIGRRRRDGGDRARHTPASTPRAYNGSLRATCPPPRTHAVSKRLKIIPCHVPRASA